MKSNPIRRFFHRIHGSVCCGVVTIVHFEIDTFYLTLSNYVTDIGIVIPEAFVGRWGTLLTYFPPLLLVHIFSHTCCNPRPLCNVCEPSSFWSSPPSYTFLQTTPTQILRNFMTGYTGSRYRERAKEMNILGRKCIKVIHYVPKLLMVSVTCNSCLHRI